MPHRVISATHAVQFPSLRCKLRRESGGRGRLQGWPQITREKWEVVCAFRDRLRKHLPFMHCPHQIGEEQGAKDMEASKPARGGEQEQAIEEAYRRGYHHGLFRARELLLRLFDEGMPKDPAMELCRVFEEQIIQPWRSHATSMSSAPPLFDVEECQRLLRDEKGRQSGKSS